MVDREIFFSLESIRTNTQNNISNQNCEKKHKIVCYEYQNAISLGEVDVQYAIIHCWWYSSDATDELGVYELDNWLNFWHFCVRMGRIMIHVLFSTYPHIFSFTPPFWQVHIYGNFHFKIAYQTFFSYRITLPKNLQTCPHVTFQRQYTMYSFNNLTKWEHAATSDDYIRSFKKLTLYSHFKQGGLLGQMSHPTFGKVQRWHSHSRNGDLGVLRDSQNFRVPLKGSKHLALKRSLCHWKAIEV